MRIALRTRSEPWSWKLATYRLAKLSSSDSTSTKRFDTRLVISSCSCTVDSKRDFSRSRSSILDRRSRMAWSLASCVLSAAFSCSMVPSWSRSRRFSLTSSSVSSAPRWKNVCKKASRFSFSSAATASLGRSLRALRPFFSVMDSSVP